MKKWRSGISVVIPTYNRSQLLNLTLNSLVRQTLNNDLFEVIVVDDGSSDNTSEIVQSFANRLKIKYLFQEDLGFRVARARNLGIACASFEHILFIDSGVLVAPNCLQSHLRNFEICEVDVQIGLCYGFEEHKISDVAQCKQRLGEPDIFSDSEFLAQYKDCRDAFLAKQHYSLKQTREPWLIFWTCHASCKTAALYAIDGFDETFTSWGGEDVELALRLQNLGYKFAINASAQAIHYPHHKDQNAIKRSAKTNIEYIHNKHCTVATLLLKQGLCWKDILASHTQPITYNPTSLLQNPLDTLQAQ
ncbi:glycosyltransferase [Pseudoalteromonas sp. JBTF-M23]|uniref:Glycosyltransferase n=1 Tax=Pseudoalteromonas caenipelagi TaxID=2726988 RepID=A0A849VC81_9GAMM|nr:glycosyltransferase [Pseudoalteromonas caenipelagi]NOU50886.1 glycosyltransferase [Pseudoalteromonas caenipelagi]